MRTRLPAAAAAVTAAVLLAGCGGSNGSSDRKSSHGPSPAAAAATASSPSPASHAVKLSTEWVQKIDILTSGTGASDCTDNSGSDGCVQGITNSVTLLNQLTHAIGAANATGEYPKTIAEITKLLDEANTYTEDQCPGDPNADVDGSPCYKNAIDVTVGMTTLEFIMQTDEANAGVS